MKTNLYKESLESVYFGFEKYLSTKYLIDDFYSNLIKKFQNLISDKKLFNEEVFISWKKIPDNKSVSRFCEKRIITTTVGEKILVEADFDGYKGEAVTDMPVSYCGRLRDILLLNTNSNRNRAILISALNAAMSYLYNDLKTIHCKKSANSQCAAMICEYLNNIGCKKVFLIGTEPTIQEILRQYFEVLFLYDKDERYTMKYNTHMLNENFYKKADAVIASGSSIVNGSIVDIIANSKKYNKKLYFYGTTIAGAANLLGLNRFCYKSI